MFQTLPYLEIAGLTQPRFPQPVHRAQGVAKAGNGVFASLDRRIGAWLERRRTVRKLSRLDDRLLADIGLTRADIPEAVRSGISSMRPSTGVEWFQPHQVVFGVDAARKAVNDNRRKIAA
jgi:uncharacterized protein YjiS (DUF1127 family)